MYEDAIAEIENSISETERRLKYLLQQRKEFEDNYAPPFVAEDVYEHVVEQDPMNFVLKSQDSEKTTPRAYAKLNVKTLKPLLRYFEGKSDTEKKAKLIALLRKAPGLRTYNLKLLDQRLFVFNRGVRNGGYMGPLEDYPDTIATE